jgi:hypothetical protein
VASVPVAYGGDVVFAAAWVWSYREASTSAVETSFGIGRAGPMNCPRACSLLGHSSCLARSSRQTIYQSRGAMANAGSLSPRPCPLTPVRRWGMYEQIYAQAGSDYATGYPGEVSTLSEYLE